MLTGEGVLIRGGKCLLERGCLFEGGAYKRGGAYQGDAF